MSQVLAKRGYDPPERRRPAGTALALFARETFAARLPRSAASGHGRTRRPPPDEGGEPGNARHHHHRLRLDRVRRRSHQARRVRLSGQAVHARGASRRHPEGPGQPERWSWKISFSARELRARDEFDRIVGQSKAMRSVLDLVARAAPAGFRGAHHRRKRNGQGARRPGNPSPSPRQAAPFVRGRLRRPGRAARSRTDLFGHAEGRLPGARETKSRPASSWPTAERSSSTRSRGSASGFRASSSGPSRSGR